jgi:hypothetical protein
MEFGLCGGFGGFGAGICESIWRCDDLRGAGVGS